MHELSIASAVANTASRHAEGRPITLVTLHTGALRQVVPASLDFYWEIVTRGTPCEGARLEQVLIPARVACRACEHAWELDEPVFRCPSCGATDVEVRAGEELEVDSIEINTSEEATCIG